MDIMHILSPFYTNLRCELKQSLMCCFDMDFHCSCEVDLAG